LGCLKATGQGEGDQPFQQGFATELILIPGTQYPYSNYNNKQQQQQQQQIGEH
jgi:hypothetical protein